MDCGTAVILQVGMYKRIHRHPLSEGFPQAACARKTPLTVYSALAMPAEARTAEGMPVLRMNRKKTEFATASRKKRLRSEKRGPLDLRKQQEKGPEVNMKRHQLGLMAKKESTKACLAACRTLRNAERQWRGLPRTLGALVRCLVSYIGSRLFHFSGSWEQWKTE